MAKKNEAAETLAAEIHEIDGNYADNNTLAARLIELGYAKPFVEEHPNLDSYKDGEAVAVLVMDTGEWEDTWITETHGWGIEVHTSRGPRTIGQRQFIKHRKES